MINRPLHYVFCKYPSYRCAFCINSIELSFYLSIQLHINVANHTLIRLSINQCVYLSINPLNHVFIPPFIFLIFSSFSLPSQFLSLSLSLSVFLSVSLSLSLSHSLPLPFLSLTHTHTHTDPNPSLVSLKLSPCFRPFLSPFLYFSPSPLLLHLPLPPTTLATHIKLEGTPFVTLDNYTKHSGQWSATITRTLFDLPWPRRNLCLSWNTSSPLHWRITSSLLLYDLKNA